MDDVIDSGETLKFTKNYMISAGAKEVMTAALCFKPRSVFVPDFYGFETKSWVIFPHENREFIECSYKMWSSKGIENEEIRKRFLKIGLPVKQIEYFMTKAAK
ncbi:hypothetical protein SDC9_189641 [bioreactor metagenome]|uniref:Phosphoribosyltransferase domain-containing protein n=1 Tax=bioreactor metagenome TaxID=1076179 RepID=A0A645HSQ8_9ZZZZ